MKPVLFWGATGQARVLRELLSYLDYVPVALFDNRSVASPFRGVPIYQGEAGFLAWRDLYGDAELPPFCVAIGGEHGRQRHSLQDWLRASGLVVLTAVHPRSFVANDASLGAGTQVLAMAAIASGARIGDAGLINTSASVDHDCLLGHGVHVGPGAHIAGEVVIDDYAFVGAGAVVLPRRRIGSGAVVGAGAVVTRDVPASAVVAGNPARATRSIKPL